jgi:hypothetical protein
MITGIQNTASVLRGYASSRSQIYLMLDMSRIICAVSNTSLSNGALGQIDYQLGCNNMTN